MKNAVSFRQRDRFSKYGLKSELMRIVRTGPSVRTTNQQLETSSYCRNYSYYDHLIDADNNPKSAVLMTLHWPGRHGAGLEWSLIKE